MPDMLIITRRQKAYLIPQTDRGKNWLWEICRINGTHTVDQEDLEDMILLLKEHEVTYEE